MNLYDGCPSHVDGKKVVSRIAVWFNTTDLVKIVRQYCTPRDGLKLEGVGKDFDDFPDSFRFYCDKASCKGAKRKDCYSCFKENFNEDGPVEIADFR